MTGAEMERAIEFLLEHQASLDQRIEQTNIQLGELSQRLNTYAEIQSEFIEIATRSIQALGASQERTDRMLGQLSTQQLETGRMLAQLGTHQVETDRVLAQLSTHQVETDRVVGQLAAQQLETGRVLAQLGTHQVETDARLDRLTVLIERLVSGRNGQE